jgi:hypothetical protein
MGAEDDKARAEVIRKWQGHFNLSVAWAFESARMTLLMWSRSREFRRSLQFFVVPDENTLASESCTFEVQLMRQFYRAQDFELFKQSVHGALETELEVFRKRMGLEIGQQSRKPRNLRRAYECLALRVCKGLSPAEISSRPEYRRDWTTLARDIKSMAEIIGLMQPPPGRPSRKIGR